MSDYRDYLKARGYVSVPVTRTSADNEVIRHRVKAPRDRWRLNQFARLLEKVK